MGMRNVSFFGKALRNSKTWRDTLGPRMIRSHWFKDSSINRRPEVYCLHFEKKNICQHFQSHLRSTQSKYGKAIVTHMPVFAEWILEMLHGNNQPFHRKTILTEGILPILENQKILLRGAIGRWTWKSTANQETLPNGDYIKWKDSINGNVKFQITDLLENLWEAENVERHPRNYFGLGFVAIVWKAFLQLFDWQASGLLCSSQRIRISVSLFTAM